MSPTDDPETGQTDAAHPTSGLDETVHQRHRLGILTITAEAQRADFGYLREALRLTPGNLSKHLTVLEAAGLVEVEKGYAGRRPRTWVRITAQGRSALAAELTALTELLDRHKTARPHLAVQDRPVGRAQPGPAQRTGPDPGNAASRTITKGD